MAKSKRIIIVSNRLPVTLTESENGTGFTASPGGLASGLFAYFDSTREDQQEQLPYIWVGWPGAIVEDEEKRDEITQHLAAEFSAYPVFLSEQDMDGYYYGFANKTLWPQFHYFYVYSQFQEEYWQSYRDVNRKFLEALRDVIQPGDTVWVHDYHLLLLPAMLRAEYPELPIGFFLHIPFPTYETFRQVPKQWGHEILKGMLGADLIGFHTYNYSHCFLRCLLRMCGHESIMGRVNVGGRIVKVDTFPMGIEFNRYYGTALEKVTQTEAAELRKWLPDCRIILSVDRLDYTKGILNRLQGYELFLRENPEWHGKVSLLLVVVPSREAVEQYDAMKQMIDEKVGQIQGKYGQDQWMPIIYHYKSFNLQKLCAAYVASDVALVTPLRDGMNLIAKEYVAARTNGDGVLVLSELAGAAEELGEAVLINPNHVREITEGLKVALEMPLEEQRSRMAAMQDRISRYDVIKWAEDFMQQLGDMHEQRNTTKAVLLSAERVAELATAFARSQERLLLLDYDGTLVSFAPTPAGAAPTATVLSVLERLSMLPKTSVAIISGRPRGTLENWFGHLPIHLVAEHGACSRLAGRPWNISPALRTEWKSSIRPILETHVDRLPGSFVEEKEFTLVWHYRKANPELAAIRAKELIDSLVMLTANISEVQVMHGNKIVEVRNANIHKGIAAQQLYGHVEPDFVMCIGDDWTDEDMFRAMGLHACTVKVGSAPTEALHYVPAPGDVVSLLEQFAAAAEEEEAVGDNLVTQVVRETRGELLESRKPESAA